MRKSVIKILILSFMVVSLTLKSKKLCKILLKHQQVIRKFSRREVKVYIRVCFPKAKPNKSGKKTM